MSLVEEVVKALGILPEEEQQEVLTFAKELAEKYRLSTKSPKLMIEMAGTIDPEYATELEQIIEEGCEQVNLSEW